MNRFEVSVCLELSALQLLLQVLGNDKPQEWSSGGKTAIEEWEGIACSDLEA